MSIKTINVGAVQNDGTGDPLRDAFVKVNENFAELEGSVGSVSAANAAALRDRATHTGQQAIGTVAGLQSALDARILASAKGSANGVASLDEGGKVPESQLPAIAITDAVRSVAGKTGAVTLTPADVGLGNADNTSDANKPVSAATQTALNGKANTSHTHAVADVTGLQSALDGTVKTSGDQTIGGSKTFSAPLTLSSTRFYQNAASIGFEFGPGVGTGNTTIQGFYVGSGKTLWFGANAGGGRMTLDGSGNFTASGDVTAYSDIRLKTDLTKIADALGKVCALNGYTYTRKDTGQRQTGLVAQEVQKVLPEAVVDNGEHLAVAYGNLVGLLIEAIKELKSEVDQLKGK